MNELRRKILKAGFGLTVLASFVSRSAAALASEWPKAAFEAKAASAALNAIGASATTESGDILIRVPDIAENGGAVPIEVASNIPSTRSITLVAEKNPFPLLAIFNFTADTEPFASTRIKLSESTALKALVATDDGKVYVASRAVRVTIGGCGG